MTRLFGVLVFVVWLVNVRIVYFGMLIVLVICYYCLELWLCLMLIWFLLFVIVICCYLLIARLFCVFGGCGVCCVFWFLVWVMGVFACYLFIVWWCDVLLAANSVGWWISFWNCWFLAGYYGLVWIDCWLFGFCFGFDLYVWFCSWFDVFFLCLD